MQGAQKLRSEAYLRVRCNDEVEAQSRSERDRWTFYETISFHSFCIPTPLRGAATQKHIQAMAIETMLKIKPLM